MNELVNQSMLVGSYARLLYTAANLGIVFSPKAKESIRKGKNLKIECPRDNGPFEHRHFAATGEKGKNVGRRASQRKSWVQGLPRRTLASPDARGVSGRVFLTATL